MTIEGEAEMVALAVVRLAVAENEDGQERTDDMNRLLVDLVERCGPTVYLALLRVFARLDASAVKVIADELGEDVHELIDQLELQEFLARVDEH